MSSSSAAPAVADADDGRPPRGLLPVRAPLALGGPSPVVPGCADCDALGRRLSRAILTGDRPAAAALREEMTAHRGGTHPRPATAA